MSYTVATFYKFYEWPGFDQMQVKILEFCNSHAIKGTILIAHEGINATICGTQEAVDATVDFLENIPEISKLSVKFSHANEPAFAKMKVKLKAEIVTMGVPSVDPTNTVGTYVKPTEWNDLVEDPDVIVVDTRNDYEYQIGTFKNAHNPKTEVFRSFPEYVEQELDPAVHKKVALFCTGGIRCEKATSFMLEQGFKDVYHLEGGILKYLEEVPTQESTWDGQCYVFDDRITIEHGLNLGDHLKCGNCGMPMPPEDALSEKYEEEVSCPKCFDSLTPERRRNREMKRDQKLVKASGQS